MVERLDEATQRAVDRYARELLDSVRGCAGVLDRFPAPFLASARRAMEGMAHLVLTVLRGQEHLRGAAADTSETLLRELRKHPKDIGRTHIHRWELLQKQGNLGAHAQAMEPIDYDEAVFDVAMALPREIGWLVSRSVVAPHLRTADRDALLQAVQPITAFARRRGGDESELGATDAITEETEGSDPSTEDLENAPTEEYDPEGAVVEYTDERLPGGPGSGAASAPLVLPVTVLPSPAQPEQRNTPLVLVAVTLLGAAMALGGIWMATEVVSTDAPPPEITSSRAEVEAPEPVAAQSVAAQTVPADPPCPEGMVRVPAATFRIGQPTGGDRDDWPPPVAAELKPVVVPRFCIDERPRTRDAFAAWPGSAQMKGPDCDWRTAGDGPQEAVVCVTRDAAGAYCDAQDGELRLPRLVEWESLARSPRQDIVARGPSSEWTEDRFPPAALGRFSLDPKDPWRGWGMFRKRISLAKQPPPDGNVLFGWWEQAPENGYSNLTFRCALAD